MKCPKCTFKMVENPDWDFYYDRLDSNYPSDLQIRNELERKGVYQYICPSCKHKKY